MRIEIKQFSLLNILIACLLVIFALVLMDRHRTERRADRRNSHRGEPRRPAQPTPPRRDQQKNDPAEHYTFRQRSTVRADRADRTTRTVDMKVEQKIKDMDRQATEAAKRGYERAKAELVR